MKSFPKTEEVPRARRVLMNHSCSFLDDDAADATAFFTPQSDTTGYNNGTLLLALPTPSRLSVRLTAASATTPVQQHMDKIAVQEEPTTTEMLSLMGNVSVTEKKKRNKDDDGNNNKNIMFPSATSDVERTIGQLLPHLFTVQELRTASRSVTTNSVEELMEFLQRVYIAMPPSSPDVPQFLHLLALLEAVLKKASESVFLHSRKLAKEVDLVEYGSWLKSREELTTVMFPSGIPSAFAVSGVPEKVERSQSESHKTSKTSSSSAASTSDESCSSGAEESDPQKEETLKAPPKPTPQKRLQKRAALRQENIDGIAVHETQYSPVVDMETKKRVRGSNAAGHQVAASKEDSIDVLKQTVLAAHATTSNAWMRYTVLQLKDHCRSVAIPVTGSKAVLISRVVAFHNRMAEAAADRMASAERQQRRKASLSPPSTDHAVNIPTDDALKQEIATTPDNDDDDVKLLLSRSCAPISPPCDKEGGDEEQYAAVDDDVYPSAVVDVRVSDVIASARPSFTRSLDVLPSNQTGRQSPPLGNIRCSPSCAPTASLHCSADKENAVDVHALDVVPPFRFLKPRTWFSY